LIDEYGSPTDFSIGERCLHGIYCKTGKTIENIISQGDFLEIIVITGMQYLL
jgi:hypothetical protein